MLAHLLHPPIGHRRGGDEDLGVGLLSQHRLVHVSGAAHVQALHATRRLKRHGARNQGHLGARFAGRSRDGKPHLAAGEVGDAAHRVDGFKGGTGGDQNPAPTQALGLEMGHHVLQDLLRLEHAAVPRLPARLIALPHAQHHRPVGLELGHIALRGRVRPHLSVHGRRQDQGHAIDGSGQAHQAEQFVGPAMDQFGHEIRAGRRHHDGIGFTAQVDVGHVVGFARVPLRGVHRPVGQGLHGDGGDELGRGLGHDHLHRGPLFDHGPAQLRRFVAGDAPAQAQDDVFVGQIIHTDVIL